MHYLLVRPSVYTKSARMSRSFHFEFLAGMKEFIQLNMNPPVSSISSSSIKFVIDASLIMLVPCRFSRQRILLASAHRSMLRLMRGTTIQSPRVGALIITACLYYSYRQHLRCLRIVELVLRAEVQHSSCGIRS